MTEANKYKEDDKKNSPDNDSHTQNNEVPSQQLNNGSIDQPTTDQKEIHVQKRKWNRKWLVVVAVNFLLIIIISVTTAVLCIIFLKASMYVCVPEYQTIE